MSHIEVHQFICREDNFGVLLHDHKSGATISIDAPDATKIADELKRRGWQLTHILVTHKHEDHVAGNLELKHEFGCKIFGPDLEREHIPGISKNLKAGDKLEIATRKIDVYGCPGHSSGHIAFHFPDDYLLFAGDTLFSLGCGRIFEGTPAQMHQSVNQFRKLHPITSVFCGHEYTLSNGRFAMTVEPGNRDLARRYTEVQNLREKGQVTLPTTIGDELKANPYLRCASPEIRATLGLDGASDVEVFAALREAKNNFK
jgi:hydroxyacylglutathione hydrolase